MLEMATSQADVLPDCVGYMAWLSIRPSRRRCAFPSSSSRSVPYCRRAAPSSPTCRTDRRHASPRSDFSAAFAPRHRRCPLSLGTDGRRCCRGKLVESVTDFWWGVKERRTERDDFIIWVEWMQSSDITLQLGNSIGTSTVCRFSNIGNEN